MVLLRDGSNCLDPLRSRRESPLCAPRTFRELHKLPARCGRRLPQTRSDKVSKSETLLQSCSIHRRQGLRSICRRSGHRHPSSIGRTPPASLGNLRQTGIVSVLLRDHRPPAGQRAFREQRSRLSVAASSNQGAAGHSVSRSKHRGGLPFKKASPQSQASGQPKPPAEEHSTAGRSIVKQQTSTADRPTVLRKSARSRRSGADTCQVCRGRGFQIVEEVCSDRLLPGLLLSMLQAPSSAHVNSPNMQRSPFC